MRTPLLSLLALGAFCQAGPALAQRGGRVTLTLQVTDSLTGRPIDNARVNIAGVRWPAMTSRDGIARATVPEGGRLVEVSRFGYGTRRLALVLEGDYAVERSIRLVPEAVRVSGVTVTARRRNTALVRNGFYRRERSGLGAY